MLTSLITLLYNNDMMNSMTFLPELTTFLVIHKTIYTVRKYSYPSNVCSIEGVGVCTRIAVKRILCVEDLTPYVDLSGFKTAQEWWKKIRKFAGSDNRLILYKVCITDGV